MGSFKIPMHHGAYQDNGASPWYASLPVGENQVGSPAQYQKFALDTGTNMVWVTSTQCTTDACMMHNRFDPDKSSSFQWIDKNNRQTLKYGPWGELIANIGSDKIGLPGAQSVRSTFGLAIDYNGPKFKEVDWDACIAFPAKGPTQLGFTFLMEELFDDGLIPGGSGFVCFDWDTPTDEGSCLIGDVDFGKLDWGSGVFLPWEAYNPVDYLWTTGGTSVVVNNEMIISNATFGFDSGSSRFKGDPKYIDSILARLSANTATIEIETGLDWTRQPGRLVVPPEIYMRTIEKGQNSGKTMPQFAPLDGVADLLIVGSVLMDYLYTIYVYSQSYDPVKGKLVPVPYGTWIFNKPGGPQIIQNYADDTKPVSKEEFFKISEERGASK